MKPGSVIYDLAVEQGGNSAFSELDKINVVNGIKIIGIKNLMNKLPLTASNLLKIYLVYKEFYIEKKEFVINLEDEIIEKT